MTVPRWIPFLAIALFVVAAITLGLLWSREALRDPATDARGPGAQGACAPLNQSGAPSAECPQARQPTQRDP